MLTRDAHLLPTSEGELRMGPKLGTFKEFMVLRIAE